MAYRGIERGIAIRRHEFRHLIGFARPVAQFLRACGKYVKYTKYITGRSVNALFARNNYQSLRHM